MPLTGTGSKLIHPKLDDSLQDIDAKAYAAGAPFTHTITIRRVNEGSGQVQALDAQQVRIVSVSSPSRAETEGAEQVTGGVNVIGSPSLDILLGDRFTAEGILYEVEYVRPNRQISTVARARVVQ